MSGPALLARLAGTTTLPPAPGRTLRNQHQHTNIIGGLWLSRAALSFVALAAIMGWGASFVGLHAYGLDQMVGFSYWTAWLVPGTFDGAAFGATLITYRASIHGRSAMRGRLLMWTFTGISSWINWIHQVTSEAQVVAAGLPVAAVAVFDVVLAELRADYEERHGKRRLRLRPGLLALRWLVDRTGTSGAFRRQVTDIPVSEIAGLAQASAEHAPEPPIVTMSRPGEQDSEHIPDDQGSEGATHDVHTETAPAPSSIKQPRDTAAPEHAVPSDHANHHNDAEGQDRTSEHPESSSKTSGEKGAQKREAASAKQVESASSSTSHSASLSEIGLASPLTNSSTHTSSTLDFIPDNHAERTRPGIVLPFTPNGEPNNGQQSQPTSPADRANPPTAPILARSQPGRGSDSFAERWARARDEPSDDQPEDDEPEDGQPRLLVIDRRGGQPTRTSQPASTPGPAGDPAANGSPR